MNLKAQLLCKAAGALFTVGASFFVAREVRGQVELAATRDPFTIILSEKTSLLNEGGAAIPGSEQIRSSIIRARRSDGSLAELVATPPTASINQPSILSGVLHLVTERETIRFNTQSRSRTSLPLKDEEAIAIKAKSTDATCRSVPKLVVPANYLGPDSYRGFPVEKLQLAENANSTTRIEVWLAPAFGCEALVQKIYFRRKVGEPLSAVSIKEAIQLGRGEPAPRLFQPTGQTERSPTEYFRTLLPEPSANPSSVAEEKLSRLDRVYRDRRPNP